MREYINEYKVASITTYVTFLDKTSPKLSKISNTENI